MSACVSFAGPFVGVVMRQSVALECAYSLRLDLPPRQFFGRNDITAELRSPEGSKSVCAPRLASASSYACRQWCSVCALRMLSVAKHTPCMLHLHVQCLRLRHPAVTMQVFDWLRKRTALLVVACSSLHRIVALNHVLVCARLSSASSNPPSSYKCACQTKQSVLCTASM